MGIDHTYFGEAVLRSFDKRDRSLSQIVADIWRDVAAQERAHGHTPSEPQVFVVRLYRPRAEILTGIWTFPQARRMN